MKLQTHVPLNTQKNVIDYNSRLLLLGSCFSQNIGMKFEYFKFQSAQNPFGILFHPKAIEKLISKAICQDTYSDGDVFFHNEQWQCFDAHSDLSDVSREGLLQKLNDGLELTHQQITKGTHVFITLGTAWVYKHRSTDKTVANCHKVPQKEFSKAILSITEIGDSLRNMIDLVLSVNPNAQLIFTVSPVRHLKDGFVENQRSKAHLLTAVHQVLEKHVTLSAVEGYFPSYEIMMDELRDYRFYASDMVHANQLAIEYIWEKFKTVWISKKAYETMEKVDVAQKGLGHRPFNPDSEAHDVFTRSLKEKITYLKRRYPFMVFDTN